MGKVVKRISFDRLEKEIIDLSSFDKGFYLIRISGKDKVYTTKLVVE